MQDAEQQTGSRQISGAAGSAYSRATTAMTTTKIFEFGQFRLEDAAEQLYFGPEREPVKLTRIPFRLLKLLLEEYPAPVRKDEISVRLWGGEARGGGTVDVHLSLLRRALKEYSTQEYIDSTRQGFLGILVKVMPSTGEITEPLAQSSPRGSPAPGPQDRRAWKAYANSVIDSHLNRSITEYSYSQRRNAVPMRATMGENFDFHSDGVELLLKHLALRTFTLLIGEYGSGKTYTAGVLAYRLARNFIEDPNGGTFLPVIVPLRHATGFTDLGVLLRSTLEMQYGLANYGRLISAQHAGRLALILDGFDEMLARTDRKDVFFHLDVLIESTFFLNTPVVITTRPNVISSGSYKRRLGESYKVITIDPMERADVEKYLRQERLDPVLAKIKESHSSTLADLLSRPLYVEMIIATADRIANLSDNEKLGLCQLYGFYFEYWYQRELRHIGRPPADLDYDAVRTILSTIALQISVARATSISADSIRIAIEALAPLGDNQAINTILTVAKERLILTPMFSDGEVQYSFRHDSLRSYFYATELARKLAMSDVSERDLAGLDRATIDFLFGFVQDDVKALAFLTSPRGPILQMSRIPPGYRDVLRFLWDRERREPITHERIHWLCSGPEEVRTMTVSNLNGLTLLRDCTFAETPLTRVNCQTSIFEQVTFENCDLCEGDFRYASLVRCSMIRVALQGAIFQDARLSGSNIQHVVASDVNFAHAIMTETRVSGAALTKSDFRGSLMSGLGVQNSQFIDCDFSGTDLRPAAFAHCHFHRCKFSRATYATTTFSECEFQDCDMSDSTKV